MRKYVPDILLLVVGAALVYCTDGCGGEDSPLSYGSYSAEWALRGERCEKGGIIVRHDGEAQLFCDEDQCDYGICREPYGGHCEAVPLLLTQTKTTEACLGRHIVVHAKRDDDFSFSRKENLHRQNLCSRDAEAEPPLTSNTLWRAYLKWCAPPE
jgi:hypothetical protein